MKRIPLYFAIACLMMACATTPTGKFYDAEVVFDSSVKTLVQARQANKIDDATWHTINVSIQSGSKALDAWHAAVASNDANAQSTASIALDSASAALTEAAKHIAK